MVFFKIKQFVVCLGTLVCTHQLLKTKLKAVPPKVGSFSAKNNPSFYHILVLIKTYVAMSHGFRKMVLSFPVGKCS